MSNYQPGGTRLIIAGTGANNMGIGTQTPGRGSKGTPQGMMTVDANHDKTGIAAVRQQAAERKTPYPAGGDDTGDILTGEDCFVYLRGGNDGLGTGRYGLFVMASLNGLCPEAVEAYPDDRKAQLAVLMNSIKYAGVSRDDSKYSSGAKRQGIALQNMGESHHHADNDMPPGYYAELAPPDDDGFGEKMIRPYIAKGKVLLEARPHRPDNIGDKVATIIRMYLQDPAKFRKAMDPKLRQTHSWVNVVESMIHSYLTAWAIITGAMMDTKTIRPIEFDPNGFFNLAAPGTNPSGHEVLLGITRALGQLPNLSDQQGREISPRISITGARIDQYTKLRFDLVQRLFYDGRIAPYGYGYNPHTYINEGIDQRKGIIDKQKAKGNMLFNQINHHKRMVGALNDAVCRDMEWRVGKITKAGVMGQKYARMK
jgi:hypothetical protein